MPTRQTASVTFAVVAFGCAVAPAHALDQTAWIDDLGLSAATPLVLLPPAAGAVIGIDEQRKTNSYVQTVTLQGDPGTIGENRITVTVTRMGLAPRLDQNEIGAEIEDRLPAMSTALGPTSTRNGFGLFGTATGRMGGLSCLYGWQSVNLADRWITGKKASPLDEQHALSIRVRLCRTNLREADLIALMAAAQSGFSYSGTLPQVSLGYDALSAAASVDPAASAMFHGDDEDDTRSRPRRRFNGFMPMQAEVADPVPRRAVQRRRRSPMRDETASPSAPPPPPPMAGMPAVPLP